jgi:Ca2+-binding EF-hand superfamily protein
MLRVFESFDAERTGMLKASAWIKVVTKMGEPLTEKQAEEALKDVDIDENGYFNYGQYTNLTKALQSNRMWHLHEQLLKGRAYTRII